MTIDDARQKLLNDVKAELCGAIIRLDDLSVRQIGEIAGLIGVEIDLVLKPKEPTP